MGEWSFKFNNEQNKTMTMSGKYNGREWKINEENVEVFQYLGI